MRALPCIVALAVAPAAFAAPRPLPAMADYRLVFLDGDDRAPVRAGASGDAMIDVGRLVAKHARTVVQRRFRLRIDGGAARARFVRVHAYLQTDAPGCHVRLDGRILTSTPQLVDAANPLRVAVAHTLEIEVPASEPAGAVAQTIGWIVEDAP